MKSTVLRAGFCLAILGVFSGAATAGEVPGKPPLRKASAPAGKSPWLDAALRHEVDPLYLYAIALQESRRRRPDGSLRPWPWTLHTASEGALYFDTYEAVLAKLKSLLAKGETNIDVGLMQINWAWNGYRLPDPAELLRPSRNIEVAAQILREHLDTYRGDRRQAIARYHSGREDRGIPYAAAVLEIFEHLRKAEGLTLALTHR